MIGASVCYTRRFSKHQKKPLSKSVVVGRRDPRYFNSRISVRAKQAYWLQDVIIDDRIHAILFVGSKITGQVSQCFLAIRHRYVPKNKDLLVNKIYTTRSLH